MDVAGISDSGILPHPARIGKTFIKNPTRRVRRDAPGLSRGVQDFGLNQMFASMAEPIPYTTALSVNCQKSI